jgi:hypothetical protein
MSNLTHQPYVLLTKKCKCEESCKKYKFFVSEEQTRLFIVFIHLTAELRYALLAKYFSSPDIFLYVAGGRRVHFTALHMTTVLISSAWLLFYGQPL